MIGVRHIGIVVTDLERSLRFYRDLLELSVLRTADESGAYIDNMLGLRDVRVTTVKLAAGDGGATLVELLRFASPAAPAAEPRQAYSIGPTHVAFTVDDLDALHERLLRAGVPFNASPQLSPDGYAKVTFCRDPDGTLVELVEVLG